MTRHPATVARYVAAMDALALDEACQEAFRLVDATNEYIAASEPWALAKHGRDSELDRALWSAAEALRVAAVLLSPVMPASAEEILRRLDAPRRAVSDLRLRTDAIMMTSGTRQLDPGRGALASARGRRATRYFHQGDTCD